MVWTLIEPGVAITASSLVTIRPLLRAWKVPGFLTTENSKQSTGPFSRGKTASRSRTTGASKSANSASRSSVMEGDPELGQAGLKSGNGNGLKSSNGNGNGNDKITPVVLKTHKSKAPNMSRISEGEFSLIDEAPRDGIQVTRRIEIHSVHHSDDGKSTEMDERGMTWLAGDSSSTHSSIEMAGMSPVQGQSDGRDDSRL